MGECHWSLICLLVSTTYSYRLNCPSFSQRSLRALGICTDILRSRYTCLYDTNKLSFSEQCNRNPDFVTPGEKYVISGNLRNVDCSSDRYQPFRLWSNVSGECLHQKSLCEGEGQIITNNGSLIEDKTCRCDYTKGYTFTKRPKHNCSCAPLKEDCSCYINNCPDGLVLTSDYECGEENNHVDSKCPLIDIKRGSLHIPTIKMKIENGKPLSTSMIAVSAMFLVILAYTVIVFVYLNAEFTTGKDDEMAVIETPANEETVISTHENETNGLVQRQLNKLENEKISVEESLHNYFNVQLKVKDEALTKTKLELKQVVELKDAKILELQNLLKERCKDMENKIKVIESKNTEIENKEKEMTEREKREEQNRDHIRKLEMDRRDLHNKIQELKGNIRVFCRVRPFLNYEKQGTDCKIRHINFPDQTTIEVVKTAKAALNKTKIKKTFRFDKVFNHTATQHEVFVEISQLVQSALDGYNVCIFAYGQTGSGKTYTMEGPSVNDNDENRGMIQRAVLQIFDSIGKLANEGWTYYVDASCLEIYGKDVNDLLSDNKVGSKPEIKDINNEVHVSNVIVRRVTAEKEVYQLLAKASQNRAVAETKSNKNSSRSHSVFTLKLTGTNSKTTDTTKSTLNLVDLAGSERQNKSGAEGQQMKEATAINQSLTTLGRVIRAIKDKEKSIPYRESKLTFLLHSSIRGNSKTLMFVNVSPKEDCVEETLNSLKFATEANKCKIGVAQKNQ